MSKLYKPDQAALDLVTEPWSEAFRAQRDVGLLVPIDFHVAPVVSLRAACFANNQYEDKSFQTCFSNLLALGLRRFNVDVYWDQILSQWSLCPAQIPPPGSAMTASTMPTRAHTSSSSSVTATANPSVAVRDDAVTDAHVAGPEEDDVKLRQEAPPTNLGSPSASSTPTPIATPQTSVNGSMNSTEPYNCTSSMTLSYLARIVSDFLDVTATTTDARFTSLQLNLHAAASWNAPDQPAPQPTRFPSPGNMISEIIRGDLSEVLYTPQQLQDQRNDVDGNWYSGDPNNRPAAGYYRTEQIGRNLVAPNGWPTEAFVEFRDQQRLLATFGSIDPQMSSYNITDDRDTIFPPGTIRQDHPVTYHSDGSISSGCLFSSSESSITESTNNSWAVASAPEMSIGVAPDLLAPIPAVSNLTSCGLAALLNQTLAGVTADQNPLPYAAFVRSYLWTWAPGEPVNATFGNNNIARCAAMFTNETYPGRWRTVDCTTSLRVACQDLSTPYRWEVSSESNRYADAKSLCPPGLSFSVPHTSLENAHLLAAMRSSSSQEPIFVNLNSLDETDCWVAGTDSSCPYIPPADTDHTRIVVVPTIAAVIIFVCAVATFFVKCASNRRDDKRGRRRRMVDGWEYEGVPS
ncbi:hypothetical protein CC80DRAFT_484246 [Byssothecium circinans]|uniref:Maintenance of telomere capping protein 6 n=1 Tax=Byssothecium circinans TaxID=147558 RepID=A0A6A5TB88_9PLEO|nr:hypothetical protein CC80DRAFT_484246 [Byssothecium circinans]